MKIKVDSDWFKNHLRNMLIKSSDDFIFTGFENGNLKMRDIYKSEPFLLSLDDVKTPISCDVTKLQLKCLIRFLISIPNQKVVIEFNQGCKIKVNNILIEF